MEVLMENRAARGIRLVSEHIREGNREYVYEIGWHVPIGMFYLEEQTTYLDRKPVPETYGGIIAFSHNIKPLIKHVEELRNVKVKLKEDIAAQEQYEIAEGKRLLEKYPKWKASPENIPVLE
ncbi:MAG: hypothetical protein K6T73_10450 [Candidatus Bathyarchaeota archaeon]|nr:hypothetical protein [Candidatus Bathyarchaeota archaeon]